MNASSIDLAPALKTLPHGYENAFFIALNRAIAGSNDRFVLHHAQAQNPALFSQVLPRAIIAGLQVFAQAELRVEVLSRIHEEYSLAANGDFARSLGPTADLSRPVSLAIPWALMTVRQDTKLKGYETVLLAQLLQAEAPKR